MEQNKNRYELIFGFVTLILSFSAFKDELSLIEIDLGFYSFTLADFLLKIVYGFGICIYLYIIERIARQSKRFSTWKIIDYIERSAFLLFVLLVMTPILLSVIYLIYSLFNKYINLDEQQKASLSKTIALILSSVTGYLVSRLTSKYFNALRKSRQEEIEREEIIELDNAIRLYNNSFYSQSILEAFKVLEIHFIKLLAKRQITIPRHQFNFNDLFNYAIKLELLGKDDIMIINEIRKMRNSAAHLDIKHTKQQATKAIDFIKYLIEKTSTTDNQE